MKNQIFFQTLLLVAFVFLSSSNTAIGNNLFDPTAKNLLRVRLDKRLNELTDFCDYKPQQYERIELEEIRQEIEDLLDNREDIEKVMSLLSKKMDKNEKEIQGSDEKPVKLYTFYKNCPVRKDNQNLWKLMIVIDQKKNRIIASRVFLYFKDTNPIDRDITKGFFDRFETDDEIRHHVLAFVHSYPQHSTKLPTEKELFHIINTIGVTRTISEKLRQLILFQEQSDTKIYSQEYHLLEKDCKFFQLLNQPNKKCTKIITATFDADKLLDLQIKDK